MQIPLTKGRVAFIDDADWPLISQYAWHARQNRAGTWYASANLPRSQGKKMVRMHRLLMNAKPGEEVDHRDGDGLNNRRANLRTATKNQNQWNRRHLQAGKTSKFKGVSFERRRGTWRAQISKDDHVVNLGSFASEEAAAAAYDEAARRLFGEFAAPNH